MSSSTELYYTHLEAARAAYEDEYFKVRPQVSRNGINEQLFRAGFDRAFAHLWPLLPPERHAQETRS